MTSTAFIHLDRLTHNLAILRELADGAALWPAIKANAYGHGAEVVARHLTGTGLSYGHTFHTKRPSLIATIPVGYGDGLQRNLSGDFDVLVRGRRCRQVGRITMDQSLVDVTDFGEAVTLGDEVVIIGHQGDEEVTADELAGKLGTINYEIATSIAARVRREVV